MKLDLDPIIKNLGLVPRQIETIVFCSESYTYDKNKDIFVNKNEITKSELIEIQEDKKSYKLRERVRKSNGSKYYSIVYFDNSLGKFKEKTTGESDYDKAEVIANKIYSEQITNKISKEQKIINLKNFLKNIDNELIKVFSKFENRTISIADSNKINFSILIKSGSEEDLESKRVIISRNKRMFRLDSVDGEQAFTCYFNPIFEYLGFGKRFSLDDNHYQKMGDYGDLQYGGRIIDIKTRNGDKKYNDLLIDFPVKEHINEFGLVLRSGNESSRRLTIEGYVLLKEVQDSKIISITRRREEKSKEVYEIKKENLRSLREWTEVILKEVIEKEE